MTEEIVTLRLLVTGGAGFIGSALCRYLVENCGDFVLNIDKLTYAADTRSLRALNETGRYTFAKIDVCDQRAVLEAMRAYRPDGVMHLAAESHVDRSIDGAAAFVETNVGGTFSMLEAARAYWSELPEIQRKSFRFLHVSTDEVYGSLGAAGLFSETTPYDPSSPYSASKAASDHLVTAWHRTYGLPVLISNCSNNYGPFQFPEKLIPVAILNALHGNRIPVYGNGENVRDWLYVEDHAIALRLILEAGKVGEKYNIGGMNERRNIDVVKTICGALDELRPAAAPRQSLIEHVTDRPGHDRRYAIDASKLRKDLNWSPRDNFETGLAKTVRWYLDNEWWWSPLTGKSAPTERLGLLA